MLRYLILYKTSISIFIISKCLRAWGCLCGLIGSLISSIICRGGYLFLRYYSYILPPPPSYGEDLWRRRASLLYNSSLPNILRFPTEPLCAGSFR